MIDYYNELDVLISNLQNKLSEDELEFLVSEMNKYCFRFINCNGDMDKQLFSDIFQSVSDSYYL